MNFDNELKSFLHQCFKESPKPKSNERELLFSIISSDTPMLFQKIIYIPVTIALLFIISFIFLFHQDDNNFHTQHREALTITLSEFDESEYYQTITMLENEWIILTDIAASNH